MEKKERNKNNSVKISGTEKKTLYFINKQRKKKTYIKDCVYVTLTLLINVK